MTDRKTAAELHIRQIDYDALIATRDILAAPELPRGLGFDMSGFVYPKWNDAGHECGTACCIGGTMMMVKAGVKPEVDDLSQERIRNRIAMTDIDTSNGLGNLFYPGNVDKSWNEITREEGVKAIDAFLSGNTRDPWSFMTTADD